MDNESLKLIARLKIQAARAGLTVDVVRFAADRGYARATLGKYADLADESGVTLALQLMEKLGMVAPVPEPAPPVAPARAEPAPAAKSDRYVGRLR